MISFPCLQRKINYIHINKTGGTFVQEVFQKNFGRWSGKGLRSFGHQANILDLPDNEPFFFTFRDPFDRLCSSVYQIYRSDSWVNTLKLKEVFPDAEDLIVAISDPNDVNHEIGKAYFDSAPHISKSYWDFFLSEELFYARRSRLVIAINLRDITNGVHRLVRDLSIDKDIDMSMNRTDKLGRSSGKSYKDLQQYRDLFVKNLGRQEQRFVDLAAQFSQFNDHYNAVMMRYNLFV